MVPPDPLPFSPTLDTQSQANFPLGRVPYRSRLSFHTLPLDFNSKSGCSHSVLFTLWHFICVYKPSTWFDCQLQCGIIEIEKKKKKKERNQCFSAMTHHSSFLPSPKKLRLLSVGQWPVEMPGGKGTCLIPAPSRSINPGRFTLVLKPIPSPGQ